MSVDPSQEYYRDQPPAQTPLQMVRDFAQAMGQPLNEQWDYHVQVQGYSDLERMRMVLIAEEAQEVREAETAEEMLKELADLVYVTYGYAATFGWDLDEAVRRIHASNMSKLGDDGKPIFRADGKVLKSKNYQPPVLTDLV